MPCASPVASMIRVIAPAGVILKALSLLKPVT
jgi:hypothetical protein